MSEVRVGLVGCGGMGKGLVSQLITIDGASLVGGADPFEKARDAFTEQFEAPAFPDLSALLEAVELDAVIVATPNDGHAPNTIAAAQAGKHVFCEKPMALSLADCQAMIDACAQAKVKLQIGQVLRYLPDFAKAIEMIGEGDLGQPMHGSIFRCGAPRSEWGGDTWRDDPMRVGHYLFEVAVHEIDFARCVFGKPVAVTGWDLSFDPKSPLWARATTAVIEFESGAICVLTEGMYTALGCSEIEIAGTGGAIRFHWGADFVYKSLSGRPDFEATGAEIGESRENGLRREVREWIEAIRNDTPATIPGEEGKANIELALAILTSSARKERLTLPLTG